ncbi:6-phosphogluconate dehydrogenase [Neisseria gonorrhoeae]|uniref:6-phosphogluconate dehydrogenase n=1 Tax=Neisseria gonorrhoeae TaxID=485 RepID=A0A378W1T3_NEIGO|nr:6-phosphogluconate dehydrogenase [Neisseria gonorrhoeae]
MLIREAGESYGWGLDYGNTALLWREGCIIRSAFLGNIRDAYEANPDLVFLGADPYFKNILENCLPAWRKVVAKAVECGIPMPCMASAITFLDGYTTERLPANLLQAQRDYFGAHTYERTDKPRGEFSIPTGRARAEIPLRQPTIFDSVAEMPSEPFGRHLFCRK